MAFFSADDHSLTRLVRERLGLDFGYREDELRRRLADRMSLARCATLAQYAAYLRADDEDARTELSLLDSALTRPRTPSAPPGAEIDRALAHLREAVPGVGERPLRVLIAGCGEGAECGLVLERLRACPSLARVPARLVAVDVAEDVLRVARAAGYACDFRRADVRKPAAYADGGPYDLALCRNVLVYFDREARDETYLALGSVLAEHGLMIVSEADGRVAAGPRFAPLTGEPRILYQPVFQRRRAARSGSRPIHSA